MKRIYDWDAKFQLRNYTIADLLNCKGRKILTQTTANSMEEAAAAKDAELDLIMGNAINTAAVRQGAPDMFFTAAVSRTREVPEGSSATDGIKDPKGCLRIR